MESIVYKDAEGKNINISVVGFFSIPDLNKEYVIYAMEDDNPANEDAHVLLGEVIRDESSIQVLGILPEEQDIVVAYYNEISTQLGGE